jgi:hypothetical protein
VGAGGSAGCGSDPANVDQKTPPPPTATPPAPPPTAVVDPHPPALTWLRDARIAGFETYVGQGKGAAKAALDALATAHVNVVAVDSGLSFYLSDAGFEEEVAHIDFVARECRARGMKAVSYYPMLEVLTENAATTPNTMFKDHPDWIQIGIDGRPNVFIGGEGRVFWVPPGTESAWLCPTSGYLDYFLKRVKRLASIALDGLWGDVPLLSDIVGIWPCTNASCAAKFRKETGLTQPATEDWDDPTFRQWVAWRHRLIHDFEQAVFAAGRSVRPDFELIVETVTMDYTAGTVQGLDGASTDAGGIHRVWEIDAVSDDSGMRNAPADDWLSMAIMMRHARGCSASNPAGAITYGKEADDAERVMALAIVGGTCPYESKIPVLNATVGDEYRARMFGWLEKNGDLWAGESANSVAVLFSSASRDFVDQSSGVGLYTSVNPADPMWWSTTTEDSAKALPYLGEYRGICKALIHAHAPYDVVTSPFLSAKRLLRYPLVVAPRLVALSTAQLGELTAYVDAGGTLLVTGPDGGRLDERGVVRSQPALLQAFGHSPGAGSWLRKARGKGAVVFAEEQVGLRYFEGPDAVALGELARLLDTTKRSITANAPPSIMFDVRRPTDGRLHVLCANMEGLDTNAFVPKKADFRLRVETGANTPRRVTLSEPGSGAAREVAFVREGTRTSFDVTLQALLLARIELESRG